MMRDALIVDLFAGGGGASCGIEKALGRSPDIAVNHDAVAVAMHSLNHPETRHLRRDIWEVHPRWATGGRRVGLLWASPDCTDHSKAKGGVPKRDIRRRALAWVIEKWIMGTRPAVIILENVEEFRKWGPLNSMGEVIKSQRGTTFRAFLRMLRRYGYRAEYRELRACDYGAPTTRNRLFLIARCDGFPIVWPQPTHGQGLIPYRTAAEIIDWSLPCPSIFERKKPLAANTLRRIAQGIKKYVLDSPAPFIVSYYGPKRDGEFRGRGLDEPLPTQSTENRFGLVTPYLARIGQTGGNGKYCNGPEGLVTTITTKAEHLLVMPHLQRQFGNSIGHAAGEPTGTITAGGGGKTALVTAFLAKHYGGVVGHEPSKPIGTVTSIDHHSLVAAHLTKHFGTTIGQAAGDPIHTLTGKIKHGLVASHLIKLKGTSRHGQPVDEPMHTVQAGGLHYGAVFAFLTKYFGTAVGQECNSPVHTLTAKDRLGLVTVEIAGESYVIADIGMRMLQPLELFRAQGFPEDYQIDLEIDGRRISKADQVRMCGNSVCPDVASALARANYGDIYLQQCA